MGNDNKTTSIIPDLTSFSSIITAIGYILFAIGTSKPEANVDASINESAFKKKDYTILGRWVISIGTLLIALLTLISLTENKNNCENNESAPKPFNISGPDLLILFGDWMIAIGAFVNAIGTEEKYI